MSKRIPSNDDRANIEVDRMIRQGDDVERKSQSSSGTADVVRYVIEAGKQQSGGNSQGGDSKGKSK